MSEIVIHDTSLIDRKLTSSVTVPRNLRKYLKNSNFFAIYDADIAADRSILNIPLTAAVLPLAWLTSSDIRVDVLDRKFKESMDEIRTVFKEMYPRIPFITEIHVDNLVENYIGKLNTSNRTGMLFSGGVDSTYSLITNLHLKPKLIMLWGTDDFPYPERADHWERAIEIYTKFAREKGLTLHLVKTNASQILNDSRIEHSFHKELYNGNLRDALQHSLVLLPLAAPLSVGRFNHLLIAASNTPTHDHSIRPRATRPENDEKIVWADLKVRFDGHINRVDKITGTISDYLRDDDLTLRVCVNSPLKNNKLNDSSCEKCFRTIATLVLAGVDPNRCGFHVDESTFKQLRTYWEERNSNRSSTVWSRIHSIARARDDIEYEIPGSKGFFEWFRDFDDKSTKKSWFYIDLYNRLPYPMARLLKRVYNKLDISIREGPFRRPNTN